MTQTELHAAEFAGCGADSVKTARKRSASEPEQRSRIPNFFIVGAPKAGTTSLFTYLAAHPQVYMPELKEPFYFCSDFPGYRNRATLVTCRSDYLKLFARATHQHLALGEASSLYLFSKVAISNILDFQPDARFIVMLRNPVDLVQSFHSQLLFSLHESVDDFVQAWRLQAARARDECVSKYCLEPAVLQYRDVAMLGEQFSRLLNRVCRSRIKVLLFDEFVADPRRYYEEVLDFLNVPNDHRTDFPKVNENKTRRSRILAQFLRCPPFPFQVLRDSYIRHVGASTWPIRMVAKLNRKPVARAPLSPQFRSELEDVFYDDVRLLERLIDCDLTHWIPM
jgi:hypothetical protein